MKKALLYILAGATLAAAAVLGAAYYKLNAIVKAALESEGARVTQTTVRVSAVSLSPFSGVGSVRGLVIGNPRGYKTPSALRVGEASVAVDLRSLRSDRVLIKRITLDAPEITLEGTLSGNNLSTLQRNVEAYSRNESQEGKGAAPRKIVIGLFKCTRGKVRLALSALGDKALAVELPDVERRGIGQAEGGVTAAQAAREVLGALTSAALKAAEDAGGLGKAKSGAKAARAAGKSAASKIQGWLHRKK